MGFLKCDLVFSGMFFEKLSELFSDMPPAATHVQGALPAASRAHASSAPNSRAIADDARWKGSAILACELSQT